MLVGQEPAHVDPNLGDDHLGAEILDSRDRHDELDCGPKGSKDALHLRVNRGNGCIESVNLIEMKAQQEPMVFVTRPRRASRSSSCDALTRRLARLASLAGLVSPAIKASIIARPLWPIKSDSTESNLMLASSSVFCTRSMWLHCSRINCLRVRNWLRISCVCVSGTKLDRIRPCANSSASHMASLTSVLRPGTFFTWAAFAKTNSNSPSSRMCQTGFQILCS